MRRLTLEEQAQRRVADAARNKANRVVAKQNPCLDSRLRVKIVCGIVTRHIVCDDLSAFADLRRQYRDAEISILHMEQKQKRYLIRRDVSGYKVVEKCSTG